MRLWNSTLTQQGLKLNYTKTEYMVVGRNQNDEELSLASATIRRNNSYTYLGSVITSDGKMEPEINNRITKYSQNVGAIYPLLRDRNIPRKVKLLMFNSVLKPVLLYGCETWVLTEKLKSKIQAAEMRVLRLIFGVTKRERLRNTTIREALGVESVLLQIERCQLRWFGHVHRMPVYRDVRRIMEWVPEGRRRRGRPRLRWKDDINKIIERCGMEYNDAIDICQDSLEWRRTIRNFSTDRQ